MQPSPLAHATRQQLTPAPSQPFNSVRCNRHPVCDVAHRPPQSRFHLANTPCTDTGNTPTCSPAVTISTPMKMGLLWMSLNTLISSLMRRALICTAGSTERSTAHSQHSLWHASRLSTVSTARRGYRCCGAAHRAQVLLHNGAAARPVLRSTATAEVPTMRPHWMMQRACRGA